MDRRGVVRIEAATISEDEKSVAHGKPEDDLAPLPGGRRALNPPKNVLTVGSELVIVWEDGREDYLPFEKLRRECPCAMCRGERDLLGNVYRGPNRPLTERSFQLVSHHPVGGYALQITWGDGHNDGLYSYETLRRLGEET